MIEFRIFKRNKWILIILGLLFNLFNNYASELSNCKDSIAVIEYFQLIEKKYDIKFSYSVSMWKDIKICNNENIENLEQSIAKLESDLPLSIKEAGNNFYILIPEKSTLKFKLIDKNTNEIIPVVYITINDGQTNLYVENNQYITVQGVMPSDLLTIQASFYKSLTIPVSKLLNRQDEIMMENKLYQVNEVIVLPEYMTRGIDSKLSDASIDINIQELSSIAGETDGDVYQVLKAIPGISSPSGKPGDIIIRGNLSDLNLILFDDIPIYDKGHLFGSFSPYNPSVIKDVNVFRNSVPVEYGSKAGSMIEIETRSDILDSLNAGVRINFINGGIEFATPIVKDKLGILVSARSSINFLAESPKFKEITALSTQGSIISPKVLEYSDNDLIIDQNFADANSKIIYKPSKKHTLSLSAILIENNFDYDIKKYDDPSVLERIEKINSYNYGITNTWNAVWTNNLKSEISFTSSKFNIFDDQFHVFNIHNSLKKSGSNTINDLKFKALFDICFNEKNEIKTGYNIVQHEIELTNHNTIFNQDSLAIGTIQSVFLNYERMSWGKLLSQIGLRENYYTKTNSYATDGKISFTYLFNKDLFFKSNFSQFHQYIRNYLINDFEDYLAFKQFWHLVDDPDEITIGRQMMLGAIYKKNKWLVDIEAYYKKLENLPFALKSDYEINKVPSQNSAIQTQINSILYEGIVTNSILKNMITKGIDVLVKRKWNQIDTWVGYTLSRSYIEVTEEPAIFDRRHVVNLTCIIPVNTWTFSFNWNFSSGLPVIPYNFKGTLEETNQIDIPYTDRFPPHHQLDISITSKILKKQKKINGVIGISALNVYNRKNIVNDYLNIENSYDVIRYNVGFAPNIQLELTF